MDELLVRAKPPCHPVALQIRASQRLRNTGAWQVRGGLVLPEQDSPAVRMQTRCRPPRQAELSLKRLCALPNLGLTSSSSSYISKTARSCSRRMSPPRVTNPSV